MQALLSTPNLDMLSIRVFRGTPAHPADTPSMAELEDPMTHLLLAIGFALTLSPAVAAQTRPDFSGTWRLDEERSITPTYPGFVGPVVWVITQSPEVLTVEIRRGARAFTVAYTLSATAPSGPAPRPPSYRGHWDGETLVTETTQDIEGQTVVTREVRSLQNGGREMIVERIVQVEHGYSVRGARSYGSGRDTFVRK
jgi:hypothetical protein